MAAKKPRQYSNLKGNVPEEPTPRQAALQEALDTRATKTIAELTEEFNRKAAEAASLSTQAKALGNEVDALEILIRRRLKEAELESADVNGFVWTETCEPYPSLLAADAPSIIEYFKNNGFEDLLQLKTAEVTERLKGIVKDEAKAGELEIVEIDNGDGTTRTEVRSTIPGVKVFLKYKLSRTKGASK
jgi:hypothetical protein